MRKIRAFHSWFVVTDGTNSPPTAETYAEADLNRLKVLEGARTVEIGLESILLFHFLGASHERKDDFKALILHADWLQFDRKRRLVIEIIKRRGLLDEKQLNAFSKQILTVITDRNAFAHGKLFYRSNKLCLEYFSGGQHRSDELTDDYLTNIERRLIAAHIKLLDLRLKIGEFGPEEVGTTLPDAESLLSGKAQLPQVFETALGTTLRR